VGGRWATHVSFHVGKAWAASACPNMTASRANGQVPSGDGANLVQLRGMLPDIDELLLPNIAARKRKLDARVNIAVWRNVRESVCGTARLARVFLSAARGRS